MLYCNCYKCTGTTQHNYSSRRKTKIFYFINNVSFMKINLFIILINNTLFIILLLSNCFLPRLRVLHVYNTCEMDDLYIWWILMKAWAILRQFHQYHKTTVFLYPFTPSCAVMHNLHHPLKSCSPYSCIDSLAPPQMYPTTQALFHKNFYCKRQGFGCHCNSE